MPEQFYNITIQELFIMANARQNYYASKWGKYKPHIKRNNKATLDWLKECGDLSTPQPPFTT